MLRHHGSARWHVAKSHDWHRILTSIGDASDSPDCQTMAFVLLTTYIQRATKLRRKRP